MKVLITGAGGFIGSEVANSLSEHGFETHALIKNSNNLIKKENLYIWYCNLNDMNSFRERIDTLKPDIIFHFAANPSTIPDKNDPNNVFYTNTLMVNSILNQIALSNRRIKFVFASTILVYGDHLYDFDEDSKCQPTGMYGISKLAAENIVEYYHNQKVVDAKILRLCATVGPNLRRGILFDFIKKAKNDNSKFEIFGDSPGAIKPFCHTESVSTICRAICNDNDWSKVEKINVVPLDNISALEIGSIVLKKFEKYKDIVFLGEKSIWAGDNKILRIKNTKEVSEKWGVYLPRHSLISIERALAENVSIG